MCGGLWEVDAGVPADLPGVSRAGDGVMTDSEIPPSAVSADASPDVRQRFYMTAGRLDSGLWAAGYRCCDRCGGLTIHRLTCLRCDPTDASRIAPAPQEGVA